MNKNQKKITATASSLAAAAAIALGSIGVISSQTEKLNYEVYVVNQYVSEIAIDEPKTESVDKIELYCNGDYVDNTILPDGTIKSIPLVFTNLENLEIKMYKQGKNVGTATFNEKDELIYKH